MTFRPSINDILTIEGIRYYIAEHPAAPGIPYGQTGRRATVYKLTGNRDTQALKVFTPAFREPRIAESVDQLRPFAHLPGLQVCNRRVLTPQRYAQLLAQQPDLTYAVLMPWVQGQTWQETILDGDAYTTQQSRAVACSLVRALAAMEQQGAAHCDLSGPNVIIMEGAERVALIDVEDMYGPGLSQPDKLPAGSAGYAHRTASAGLWGAYTDRFAGAVLLAEMLGWCDERVCQAAYEEQFFDPDEMQQDCERYTLLFQVLRDQWGQSFATIFAQAWHSETLEDCPSLTEWAQLLFASEPASVLSLDTAAPPAAAAETPQPPAAETYPAELGAANQAIEELQEAYHMAPQVVAISYARALLNRGALQEQAGIWQSAVEDYQTAQSIAPAGNLQDELTSRIIRLTSQYSSAPEAPAPPQGTNGNLPHALHDTAHTNALPHSDMSEGIPTEQYIEADNSEPSGESSYMPAGTPLEARAVGGGTSPKPAQASPTGAVGANQLVGALIAIAVLIALIALALAMGGGIDGSASYADSRDTGPAAQAAQVLDTPQSTATRIPTEVSTEVPRPSATAEPMLIVDERFVDNRNGWYVGEVSTGTGVRIIRDGVYVTQIWGDHLMWWETWETQEHNFFAQVDVAALTEGSEGGLVFGYQDGENFYYAKVSADGDYLIGHSVNAEWITLIGWVQHEAVHSGIETNTVMVERQGSSIRLYVNDVLVEELVDDTFMSGQVGILAGAGRSSEAEILLDNFYLWRLP